ncbi:MAG: MotE family protein [Hyphomicrobiales bacterium]|nr:MotE family protein [Hyphomicrobiales bacterium]MBV8441363.1 MotE family protein [Hyphomicrobiales bacterium]
MPISRFPSAPLLSSLVALVFVASLGGPGAAQVGHTQDAQKPKPVADKPGDTEASRYCANVAPSIVEARIAWQTKRLSELDAQVKQRISDLEKAEATAREWIAKREELMKAASDALVAIYAKMQPENAARQISTMDDRMAAAILGKLKPTVAGAILDEMEAERASRLAGMIAGAEEKKS